MSSITYRGIWRWHFHAGLFCIPFVIVLALTGSIYLFKPQIDAFADRGVDSLHVSGPRANPAAIVRAAVAAEPGSRLFVYELPREDNDAVRVHLYAADNTGRIVYVNPYSLAVLKIVPHTARLTEVIKTIHGELLAGTAGSILVELAAGWAIVMLVTGLYLWWPRGASGMGGLLYPRLHRGRQVLWRDLHAVTGVWISVLAMFLLVTALPWTTVWGGAFQKGRDILAAKAQPQDWSRGRQQEQHQHEAEAGVPALVSRADLDLVVAHAGHQGLDPPVRIYPPTATAPWWRVTSETQNRPRQVELRFDPDTGDLIGRQGFADKGAVDRTILVGIAAHEGQLFGPVNQLLGLLTALGLVTLCISALVMWWRRTAGAGTGVPARQVEGFRVTPILVTAMVLLGVLLPVLGAALLLLALSQWAIKARAG